MGTVLRMGTYRIMIYTHDHRPAHVHVVGVDGRARIALGCPDGPATAIDAVGMEATTLRQAVALVAENLELLCTAWRSLHGTP